MRACRWIVATALLLLATAVLAPPVKAESERIHITFDAPKGCSDSTAFLRALKKWTKRFEPVTEAQTTRRFLVTIRRTASAASGQLEIRTPGAATSLRNVAGKTCDEVSAALALMTALAIDPGVRNPAPPSSSPPTDGPDDSVSDMAPHRSSESNSTVQSSSGTTAAPSPVMPRVLPTPPHPSAPDRPPPTPAATLPPAEPPRSIRPQPLRWAAGVQANASDRVAFARAWGGEIFVETTWSGTRANPVLRAGLFFSQTKVELPSGAGAKLQWSLAFLEGCPTHLVTADRRIALHPCVTANVGLLRGQGQDLDENHATAEVWADLGPTVRFRVGLWQGLSLEARGTGFFPLRRLSFDVEDAGPGNAATTVFSTPSWGVRAGIGVAYEFR